LFDLEQTAVAVVTGVATEGLARLISSVWPRKAEVTPSRTLSVTGFGWFNVTIIG